jgi:Spy/CpxP family protein refolding chaperone
MKRKMRNLLVLVLSLATLALWAERPHHGDGMGPGPHKGHGDPKKHLERMTKELSLTKEQQEKAKAFHETREALMKTQREKMQPLHEELRKLLEADKVDLAAVRRQLELIGKGHVEMRMQDIQGRLEFEALLTPEQKKKLKAMHKKRMEHGKDKPRPGEDRDEK